MLFLTFSSASAEAAFSFVSFASLAVSATCSVTFSNPLMLVSTSLESTPTLSTAPLAAFTALSIAVFCLVMLLTALSAAFTAFDEFELHCSRSFRIDCIDAICCSEICAKLLIDSEILLHKASFSSM